MGVYDFKYSCTQCHDIGRPKGSLDLQVSLDEHRIILILLLQRRTSQREHFCAWHCVGGYWDANFALGAESLWCGLLWKYGRNTDMNTEYRL